MIREADIHPCFSCTLADCDEASRQCGLKRAQAQYSSLKKRKEPVPEKVRLRYNIAFRELYGYRPDRNRSKAANP